MLPGQLIFRMNMDFRNGDDTSEQERNSTRAGTEVVILVVSVTIPSIVMEETIQIEAAFAVAITIQPREKRLAAAQGIGIPVQTRNQQV